MKFLFPLILALTALAAGCGVGTDVDPAVKAWVGGLLAKAQQAGAGTAHHGVRRIEFHWEGENGPASFSYREAVKVDASGAFAIETVQALTPVGMDLGQFLMLQQARAGFFYRYRDVAIRHLDLVFANYRLTAVEASAVVAGRPAVHLVLERTVGDALRHHVALDAETGVLLASRTYAADGSLVSLAEFESIEFGPPPAFQPHLSTNQEEIVAPGPALDAALGFPTVLPTLLPDGYQLVETARIVDPLGRVWLKATYGDGVDVAFFLCRPSGGAVGSTAAALGASAVVTPNQPTPTRRASPSPDDVTPAQQAVLLGYRAAGIQVVQCDFAGLEVIVVGRPSFSDLQWMVESVF